MPPHARRAAVAGAAAALVLSLAAPAGAAVELGFGQLAGPDGCTTQPELADEEDSAANRTCRRGHGLIDPAAIAVSPDGAHVYVAAAGSGAIATFRRGPGSGRLVETACISNNGTNGEDGTEGRCTDGNALNGAYALAVSADGRHVYVASFGSNGLAVFARDPESGALRQIQCVRPIATCTGARGVGGAASVAVSPEGRHVYVAGHGADAVATLARDHETGLLKPLECVSDDGTDGMCANGNTLRGATAVVISPDGAHVYVAAESSNAVLTFARDRETGRLVQRGCVMHFAPARGSCAFGRGMQGPTALALTPDGRALLVAAYDSSSVAVLSRNRTTGAVRFVGCVVDRDAAEYADDDTGCALGGPLPSPTALAVSADGRRVYVSVDTGLTAFVRDPVTGTLADGGCISYRGYWDDETIASCMLARGVAGGSAVALSPDARNLYLAAWESDAVSVFAPALTIAAVEHQRSRGLLAVRVACPRLHAGPCSGRITVAAAGRRIRVTRPAGFSLEPGRRAVVRVGLSRTARGLLGRGRPLRLTLTARQDGADTGPVHRRMTLRGRGVPPGLRR